MNLNRAADNNGTPLPYPGSLLEDLKSKDDSTRLSAIQAIKPYSETISLPLLLSIVMEDPNSQIRLQAIGALWNRGDSKVARVLEQVLVLDKGRRCQIGKRWSSGGRGDKVHILYFPGQHYPVKQGLCTN